MDEQIPERLDQWRTAVRAHLLSAEFAEAPAYLSEPMRYALQAEGKMLRPMLFLAAVEAVGGNWEDSVETAAALEIFHTFTLVHDDIMDGDDLRRGQPTVHKQFDDERALLAGDTLLLYVYQLLGRSKSDAFPELFQAFTSGAMEVCYGQGWDMQFEQSETVEPEAYEMMIDLKTGALLKLACHMGGIAGGGSQEQIRALSRFGLLLGRAFQMQDDLLELTSSADTMGKSLGSDVLNEKKTWIWLDLRKNLSTSELDHWQKIQLSTELSVEARAQVHEWMREHGTIGRAEALVQKWIQEADDILQQTHLTSSDMLIALADRILKRKN
ncbi:MAG: polyprenyl synthetase family protein [Candidatus Marinimicrobia bacterium]|nr:polyprenyl synthetase family protein [Candidatus Neomarinimicrobiota bacterium]MCF7851126.1 polyprenyl synthetase family protein [Candidatus Neomarinimicrobiota bacterium]MCF7904043.1 polyprenyl synthetase family protein [Candidatus Neomarinimicrobiota bacterium]